MSIGAMTAHEAWCTSITAATIRIMRTRKPPRVAAMNMVGEMRAAQASRAAAMRKLSSTSARP